MHHVRLAGLPVVRAGDQVGGVEDVEGLGAEARRLVQAPEVPPRPRGEPRLLPQFRLRQRERARPPDARAARSPSGTPSSGSRRGCRYCSTRWKPRSRPTPSSAMIRAKSCFVDDAVDRPSTRPPAAGRPPAPTARGSCTPCGWRRRPAVAAPCAEVSPAVAAVAPESTASARTAAAFAATPAVLR